MKYNCRRSIKNYIKIIIKIKNMFGLFKKKKVDNNSIEAFDSAIEAIEIFMSLSEWTKANKALDEIESKERESLEYIIDKLSKKLDNEWINQREIEKLKNIFKKKELEIKKLRAKLEDEERKYNKNIDNERFKLRFEKIREEIDSLTWSKEVDAALSILKKFLEENADNALVVKFYNSEKKKVLKVKEKVDKEKEDKVKKDAESEAMSLIWKTVNIDNDKKEDKNDKKEIWFFEKLKSKLQFAKNIKERIERKKLLDEINLLIEEDSKIKNEIASKKLATIHKTLTKDISDELQWYELFWKILSADKISWDTFWFKEQDDKYNFFIWDATWNGLRAWFIITILNRLFNKFSKWSNISELTYEINNWLKQDLKSRNFITWVFFEIFKDNVSKINFVSMGHVPVYIFRKETGKAEKVIAWGLAAGIRLIKHPADIKVKELNLEDWDILLTYSDWIVENKNSKWEMYGFDRLEKAFTEISKSATDISKIYDYIINDIKKFKWSELFDDDASTIIIKRDRKKDIVDTWSDYLIKIQWKEWLNNNEIRKLKWKSIEDIEKELVVLKKQKETDRIIKILEWYYYTWEILRLKQESIRYIKEWFIDKKINAFLKKAIDNEKAYKIKQKNSRAKNKYEILEELLKKWDYDTVINEAEKIISSDWEI